MELADLITAATGLLRLPEREILFSEGEAADVTYLLVDGRAELLVQGQTIEVAQPGAFLGELALIEPDQPRPMSVRAVTECRLARIDSERFEEIVARHPQFAVDLMKVMAERLRRARLQVA
ncbi:MAG: cyclic nucleotide-binding domain-containing protein [Rhodocyclaceae bacterium]|nr:cyclic nucleotide-binding domain-containing protein [Rhodocyclaceae bacterium]